MHLLQTPNGNVRVDLRGRDFFVVEDFLNEAQACAVLQHQRDHGVTEIAMSVFPAVREMAVSICRAFCP
jgi:hypothetical protein